MLLTPEDLHRIAAWTLGHYDKQARAYWEGTRITMGARQQQRTMCTTAPGILAGATSRRDSRPSRPFTATVRQPKRHGKQKSQPALAG